MDLTIILLKQHKFVTFLVLPDQTASCWGLVVDNLQWPQVSSSLQGLDHGPPSQHKVTDTPQFHLVQGIKEK